jgi:hypothetical protein
MTRTTMMAMVIGAILATGSAQAKIPAPVCKAQCAPRIEQDCGDLTGKAFKRCRRSLMRACKATTPQAACFLAADERPEGGRGPGGGSSGGGGSGDDGGSGGGGGGGGRGEDAVQAITDLFNNKLVTTETSNIFASGSITTTRETRLCASGAVLFVETQITSTTGLGDNDNTFDSTTTFDGTWRIRLQDDAPMLELDLGEGAPRLLAIEQDSQGRLVLDGVRANVSDATAACGGGAPAPGDGGTPGDDGTPSDGGTPDVVQQLTQALAGHALILTTTNIGSGTTTTAIVLCESGRYALESTSSAVPGRSRQSIGTWSIEVGNDGPALVLVDDEDPTPARLGIAEDTDGGLRLDGVVALEGDPSAVPGICTQI